MAHRCYFALGAIFYPIGFFPISLVSSTLLPGGYSNLEPLLPIPNRTVKRVCADDSVHSHAKVGHRQTIQQRPDPAGGRAFSFWCFIADTGPLVALLSKRDRYQVVPKSLRQALGLKPGQLLEIRKRPLNPIVS